MPRNWTAQTGEGVTLGIGGLGFAFNPGTLVAIIRIVDLAVTPRAIFSTGTASSGRWQLMVGSGVAGQNFLRAEFDVGSSILSPDSATVGNWTLVAMSLAASGGSPTFSFYDWPTNTWHQTTTVGTVTTTGTPVTSARIGANQGGAQPFYGDIALVAAWNVALSNKQVKDLVTGIDAFFAPATPKGMWILDQDVTTQKVGDLTGNGANETALTNTTVSTSSCPWSQQVQPVRRRIKVTTLATPVLISAPVITGETTVGSLLSVTTGTWSGGPDQYSYQWQRSVDGVSWLNVSSDPLPPGTTTVDIPKYGISNSYKILTRNSTDRAFELNEGVLVGQQICRIVNPNNADQSKVAATVTAIQAAGIIPFFCMWGSVAPPLTADPFASAQATAWEGIVDFYEILNEPDLHGWSPDAYADFVAQASDAIKGVNPNAIIVAGALWRGGTFNGVSYNNRDYVRSLINRAIGKFDVISLHLYDDANTRASWNVWDMAYPWAGGFYNGDTTREILNNAGLQNVPIIATEAGAPIPKYTEAQQATIVQHALQQAAAGSLACCMIYNMMNDDVVGYGMLRDDRSRRPSWTSYQTTVAANP